jgi:transposase
VAGLALREVSRIRELTCEANQLQRDITKRVTELVPSLLEIPGCGALSAAKLVGEAADISRFKSRDAYAMWAGVAPIPVWSANSERFRLNRGGNRQTNAALHRIAITQIRIHPDAQAFITRRLETGSTKREALRLLKRRLSNVVYRTLIANTQPTTLTAAA